TRLTQGSSGYPGQVGQSEPPGEQQAPQIGSQQEITLQQRRVCDELVHLALQQFDWAATIPVGSNLGAGAFAPQIFVCPASFILPGRTRTSMSITAPSTPVTVKDAGESR